MCVPEVEDPVKEFLAEFRQGSPYMTGEKRTRPAPKAAGPEDESDSEDEELGWPTRLHEEVRSGQVGQLNPEGLDLS